MTVRPSMNRPPDRGLSQSAAARMMRRGCELRTTRAPYQSTWPQRASAGARKAFAGRWAVLAILLCSLAGLAAQSHPAITPQSDGVLQLEARTATIHGQTARFMDEAPGNIGYWSDPADLSYLAGRIGRAGRIRRRVEIRLLCRLAGQHVRDRRRRPEARPRASPRTPAPGMTTRSSSLAACR